MGKKNNVLVALRLGYSSNRSFLAGIARYLRHVRNWRTTVAENFYDFSTDEVQQAVRDGFDGIITVAPHDRRSAASLTRSNIPLVVLGNVQDPLTARRKNIVFVQGDDVRIGALAAHHFLSLGQFRAFAFVMSHPIVPWSTNRYRGFASVLRDKSVSVNCVDSPFAAGTQADIDFLGQALLTLPKPLAVMAAYDQRAVQVLRACEEHGLAVPGDVSVIGTDNDPVFCEFSTPALTSVSTNNVRKGEVAAIELNRLMIGGPPVRKSVVLKDAEIVERESTAPLSPASHLVERALDYIRQHAEDGIRPRDVIAHLGVSAALVNKRFREIEGRTLGDVLTETRLRTLRAKLRTSDQKIAHLVRTCGFSSPEHAMRLFRKTFGMTMRDYRNRSS